MVSPYFVLHIFLLCPSSPSKLLICSSVLFTHMFSQKMKSESPQQVYWKLVYRSHFRTPRFKHRRPGESVVVRVELVPKSKEMAFALIKIDAREVRTSFDRCMTTKLAHGARLCIIPMFGTPSGTAIKLFACAMSSEYTASNR